MTRPFSLFARCGLLALASAATLAACATPSPKAPPAPQASTPTEQYKMKAIEAPDQVALAVHASALSPRQRQALAEFVGRWREEQGGAIEVRVPGVPDIAADAKSMGYLVQAQLTALGVPAENLRLTAYAAPGPGSPVIAAFERTVAEVKHCGDTWGSLTSTRDNDAYAQFGCSVTANMSAMLADPNDLTTPPELASSDAVRRATVLKKYRDGALTATARDDQANGAISSAVP